MGNLEDWFDFAKVGGLGAVLTIVLLWRLNKEREQDRTRIESLDKFIQDQLLEQLKIHTSISNKSLDVIADTQEVFKKVLEVLIIVDRDLKEIKLIKREMQE